MAELDVEPDPGFEQRIRESFGRFSLMRTIGATLVRVVPGEVDIELASREDLTQQHGFMAAGILTTVIDTACGYAAMSLMPANRTVLTAEYKVNLLAPAVGETMIARARVVKQGRTLTVCSGDVFAVAGGKEKIVATMLGTLVAVSLTEGS